MHSFDDVQQIFAVRVAILAHQPIVHAKAGQGVSDIIRVAFDDKSLKPIIAVSAQ